MKRNEKKQSLYKQALEAAPVVLAILGIVGTILNVYLTSRLVPLTDSITAVSQRADAFYSAHQNDVSQPEFSVLRDEIQNIQSQVNFLYKQFGGK